MKTKRLFSLLAALPLLLLGACQNIDRGNLPDGEEGGFTLNYVVEGNGAANNTRASVPAEAGEANISSLYLLFFESTTGGTGKYINYYEVPAANIPTSTAGTIEIEFQAGSGLNNSTAYNILLIANGGTYVPNGDMATWLQSLNDTMSENDVVLGTTTSITGNPVEDWGINIPIDPSDLLMTTNVQKSANAEQVNVRLIRAVSRFDVENLANGYTLETVSIWNAFPTTPIWANSYNDYASVARVKRFYGLNVNGNLIKGGLYAFENYVAAPEQDDEVTTCLIVGLKPDGGQRTYYRINIHPESRIQALKRNSVYKVAIQYVRGAGASSEADAYSSKDFLIDLKINDWDFDSNGSIQYDGDNILALPTTNISFLPAGGERVDNIFTLGAGTLAMTKQDLPDGITASLVGNTLTVRATQSNVTKQGYVELRFGNLTGVINVVQTGATEQYLTLSTYTVPEFGSLAWVGLADEIRVTSSGPWTATIYNGPFFSFQSPEAGIITKTGNNGDGFNLYTSSANPNAQARYSFVHITLKEYPEVSRTLVLTQAGTGGIDVTPLTSASFNVFGDYTGTMPTYTVSVAPNAVWEIVKSGADVDHFQASLMTNDANPAVVDQQFTITAAGENTLNRERTATFRIRLKDVPSVYTEITMSQPKHSISISPTSVSEVGATGGVAGPFTVTSSGNWEATLAAEHTTAYFNGTSGLTTVTGATGETFTINLDAITAASQSITPKVTLTVKVGGTEVTVTPIVIPQKKLQPRGIVAQSYNSGYAAWGSNGTSTGGVYQYFILFRDYMKNQSDFGPNGVVYTPGAVSFNATATRVNSTTTIFNANYGIASSADRDAAKKWLDANTGNFMLASSELAQGIAGTDVLTFLNDLNPGYSIRTYPVLANTSRTPASAKVWSESNGNRGAALWEYLTETGPFVGSSPINLNNATFKNYDGHNNEFTSWSSTVIPIILNPAGGMVVGIDPTYRIMVIGDFELFGNVGSHQPTLNDDASRFLKNIIAYVMNVSMYGDDFNDQFK